MAEEKEIKDLKDGEEGELPEDKSASKETTPAEGTATVSEDLKNSEKDKSIAETVDSMLADGTSPRKTVTIPKDKFDTQNEKSKLYDKMAPLMAKLADNPEVVDKLLGNQDETLESRMARLEDDTRSKKRGEMKQVITEAVSTWEDFQDHWESIKPIVASLEKQGLGYRDAVQRAYFAVNPEAVANATRIVDLAGAREAENERGKQGPSGGFRPVVRHNEGDDVRSFMSDADVDFAKKMGIDPQLYKKHSEFISKFKNL